MNTNLGRPEVRARERVGVPTFFGGGAPRRFGFREVLFQSTATYAHVEMIGTKQWLISLRSLRSFGATRKL
jgi:hypothetical protein